MVFICILILTAILFDSKHFQIFFSECILGRYYNTAILMTGILYEKVVICLGFKRCIYNHFAVILDHKLKKVTNP